MTDYYQILGVEKTANPEQIKKAYRKLAQQNHPDKEGGNLEKFKEISVAYDTLGDENKRRAYDNGHSTGGPRMPPDFHDMFSQAFGPGFNPHFVNGFGQPLGRQHQRRNTDLNLQCHVSFSEAFHGKKIDTSYTLPSGRKQKVFIDVPAGIDSGNTITYNDLGDDSVEGMPRGKLTVAIMVQSDPQFERRGSDVYTTVEINSLEAIIGCKKQVASVSGDETPVEIRPGVQSGTEYARRGVGFVNLHSGGGRGRFVIVVKIVTPEITDNNLLDRLRQINEELTT